jgi:hypothetical protein
MIGVPGLAGSGQPSPLTSAAPAGSGQPVPRITSAGSLVQARGSSVHFSRSRQPKVSRTCRLRATGRSGSTSALRSAEKIADAPGDPRYRLTQARAHAAHDTAHRPGHAARRWAQP